MNRNRSEAYLEKVRQYFVWYMGAVKPFRIQQGISQTDIPGLSRHQVSRIERGKVYPTVDAITKLAKAHKMSVNRYMRELASRSAPIPTECGEDLYRKTEHV